MKRVLAVGAVVATVVLAGAGGRALGAASACPTTNPPNELVLSGGSAQQAQLGKQFAESLKVELANTNGCSLTGNLAGVSVNFDAPGSGASGVFASSGSREAYVGTDSQGVATAPSFIANFTAGTYTVDAHSDYGTVEIGLTNTANGLPAAIAPQGLSAQEAPVSTQYAQPVQARVTDSSGAPIQGAAVNFSVVPGATGAGGSFIGGQSSSVTNANGVATSPPVLANGVPGKFTVTASTDGLSSVATFALDNHAAALAVSMVTPFVPSATVDARYRDRLQARVVDATGQPVEGATVTFAIAAGDSGAGAGFLGSGAQSTALTDVGGRAISAALVANKIAGAFTATVETSGAEPLALTLTNVAAAPYVITAGAASGTFAVVGTRFDVPLAVSVTDRNGNPVKGAVVVFTAPVKGASGHFLRAGRIARAATNADGIAIAPRFIAGRTPGGFAVLAHVVGTTKTAAFALVDESR